MSMYRTGQVRLSLVCAILALGITLIGCGSGGSNDEGDFLTLDGGSNADAGSTDDTTADDSDGSQPDGMVDASTELCGEELEKAAIGIVDKKASDTVQSTPETTGYTTTVEVPWGDSADSKPYVYLRLLKGTFVPLTDEEALEDDHWDMAIRGATIRLNGGVSGPGNVAGAALDGQTFSNVDKTDIPSSLEQDALITMCAPSSQASGVLDTAVGKWWTDGSSRQTPTPAEKTYVIRTVDGENIKLQIDKAELSGGSGKLTLRWAKIDQGPACDVEQARRDAIKPIKQVSKGAVSDSSGVLSVDASAGGIRNASNRPYVYIDLDKAKKVEIDDVQAFSDKTWDIALERVVLRVNGGDSGSGGVSVSRQSGSSLGDVTSVPDKNSFETDDFVDENNMCKLKTDRIGNPTTAIAGWYQYKMQNGMHQVVPVDAIYVVETTEGNHVKLRIKDYSDGQFEIAHEKM